MLTFLRKIRKSLIETGGVRKYVIYAIGEIALVVIGILIALQINNWNEDRKERIKEKEILRSLAENMELNIRTLKFDIERLHIHNQSSEIVLNVLDNRLPFVDSLAAHFHLSRVPKIELSFSQSGYEQFRNAGFDIVLNNNVKDEIIEYFESTLPQWFTIYNQVNASYVPFIDHHVPLFIYSYKNLVPVSIENLYEDNYFIGWLRAYKEGRNTLIMTETEFIEESQRVLQLIKVELGM